MELKFEIQQASKEYAELFAQRYGLDFNIDPAEVATQIKGLDDRLVLVAAIDHWAEAARRAKDLKLVARLTKIAQAVDPDPWRDAVRAAVAKQDTARLQELAKEAKLAGQSPHIILLLASNLPGKGMERANLLRKALVHHPANFWLNFELGNTLEDPAERAASYKAALAIRPDSSIAHNNLGIALAAKKDMEGAIAEFQKAIQLDPTLAQSHNNLGQALKAKGRFDEAIKCFQKALDLDPNFAAARTNLEATIKQKKEGGSK
jgi:tetratricopeptide (TPR) repeat protein